MKTIEYKVSFEKMISRLPALFAYLESDDYGVVSLHKATDSLDGCWGKIVENIKLPEVDSENENFPEGVSLTINGKDILEKGEVYTFRTIIDHYYQYREELLKINEEDVFVKFIERAIGKVKVEDFEGKTEATPEYIYLSNVKRLYNELVKMKKMCDFYHDNQDKGLIDKDKHLCCLCERYEQLGGDKFKDDVVAKLIPEADKIAEEYKRYAHNEIVIKNCCQMDENNNEICVEITRDEYDELPDTQKLCCKFICPLTLDFDIDLVSTYQDMGIMTPYAPIWLPYKRYYIGDKVEYNGELYICIEENTGKWSDDYLTVVFDDEKFKNYNDFDSFSHILTQEAQDEYKKASMVVFNEDGYTRPTSGNGIGVNGYRIKGIEKYDEETNKLVVYKPIQTDSKLIDLRRFVTYYNDDGLAERPKVGEDWLFYYRKGSVVNIRTINDNLGNVVSLGNMEVSCTDANDLAAYGDVIVDITYDEVNNKIKFTYRTGVHLKAEGEQTATPTITLDDDGNEIIKWDKFVWDNDDKIGIKYEEEYNYEEGSDLDKLIKGEFVLVIDEDDTQMTFEFDRYIKGEYDSNLPTYKFEFITINNLFNYDKTIANQDVNIVSTLTELEASREDFDDFAICDLYREDYLNGITYKPTKDIDVNIKRGSTSVFDRHIIFSEIKTLDDMVTFKNSSFFKMTKE